MTAPRAWLIWTIGIFGYLVAVAQRTSFGVVGLEATERFHATASAISFFTVLQLLVYAGLQIPVGLLVDRFGSRAMIAGGAVLMGLGQLQLAFAESIPGGVLGRVLVGAGDAMTFISVIRLIPLWFAPARVPLVTQLTGMSGQLGQLFSVLPFALVLHLSGWTPAFLMLAGMSALAVVLVVLMLQDAPPGSERPHARQGLRATGASLARAWRQPGTRLGMWSHFTIQFSGTVFAMTWGYPFLISGQGLDAGTVAALMALYVAAAMAVGPFIGRFVSRHPLRRSTMVLLIAGGTAAAWAAVLLLPGRAPLWLLAGLVVVLAIGGPGSMIGFDFARTFNPAHRIGTATGIVNVGGFIAALVSIFLIGLVLDVLYASGFSQGVLYGLDPFRLALSVQFLVLAFGAAAILASRRKVRRQMAAQGIVVPPLRSALARQRREILARRRQTTPSDD
ncbi:MULTISPECIES: MFS transporter [Pseudarthrobacter]|uniref:MFS family permease n=1 Tax=Pseudarthrobacter niigatensis TaxID=369935 RepID=A0AAJ1WEZ9_9MICC|nr:MULTISPECIES: MFS transporter [Pseudarthrobacter]MDQ0147839.1 MFS family permease [Pseudarthrobacter niigatensis]MDQ0267867.1 MFS family permease [Pseudarthrobacter niigatensis]QDG63923.1 MFS transporter [Pseudarthrobacter sp. NIBRBAC000502771]QDG87987.1 MFS transporter [Pseudarthrobacter sp. NIBRBAC000502770]